MIVGFLGLFFIGMSLLRSKNPKSFHVWNGAGCVCLMIYSLQKGDVIFTILNGGLLILNILRRLKIK